MLDKETIEKYKKAGRIAAEALEHGRTLIKAGARVVDICDEVDKKARALGGEPAFPAQISINNIAAHYCSLHNDPLVCKEGDVVKLDVGVHVDGFIGDNALTVDLGDNKELVQASLDGLNAALKIIKAGVPVCEIGQAILDAIQAKGFSPVKNLSGHGLDQFEIHTPPTIPNFNNGNHLALQEGMAFAVEPFATDGHGMIFEASPPTIYALKSMKPVRGQYAKDVLDAVKKYNGLPFALRWVTRELGEAKARFGIRELERMGILIGFPPLPEKANGLVSQHEHTILLLDRPFVTTKLD
ncbi:MAG: type II methionyl aminopeptidase [Candidatus Woesearchaeota archaeon]